MSNENTPESEKPDCARPYWFPDVAIEDLPEGLQTAVEGIIEPGYQDLVMGARSTMERLAGISVIHLTHLEILDQLQLASELPTAARNSDRTRWRRTCGWRAPSCGR